MKQPSQGRKFTIRLSKYDEAIMYNILGHVFPASQAGGVLMPSGEDISKHRVALNPIKQSMPTIFSNTDGSPGLWDAVSGSHDLGGALSDAMTMNAEYYDIYIHVDSKAALMAATVSLLGKASHSFLPTHPRLQHQNSTSSTSRISSRC